MRSWAAACATCHGSDGSAQPGLLPLAGRSQTELVAKMQNFKTGAQGATVMHQLAKGYSDAQIQAIAAYFAAQRR